jgi:hypothetical protein
MKMSLPNIDVSPLLEFGWVLLQWVFRMGWLLGLVVFLLTVWAGAGDMMKAILDRRRTGNDREEVVSRVRE